MPWLQNFTIQSVANGPAPLSLGVCGKAYLWAPTRPTESESSY